MSMTKDEQTVYVFALRYALPRHSYALSIVSQMILSKLNDFEDWELDGMIRDCWIYYPSLDCGGDMDRRKADEFKNKLLAELSKRGRDDLLSRIKDEVERRGMMSKDKLPEQDKEAVQDLMAFKERYKNGK